MLTLLSRYRDNIPKDQNTITVHINRQRSLNLRSGIFLSVYCHMVGALAKIDENDRRSTVGRKKWKSAGCWIIRKPGSRQFGNFIFILLSNTVNNRPLKEFRGQASIGNDLNLHKM